MTPPPRWTARTEWFDWVVVFLVAGLAVATIWTTSGLITSLYDLLLLGPAWAGLGAAWLITVGSRTTSRTARYAIVALAILGGLTFVLAVPFFLILSFASPAVIAVAGVASAAALLLAFGTQRPVRIIWLAAPAIVVLTLAVCVTPLPDRVRLAISLPALTTYVESMPTSSGPEEWDEPVDVGGVPIYGVEREAGQVRLITGYVGILEDDAAGLLYRPEGLPTGVERWEHLTGPWYRWYPY